VCTQVIDKSVEYPDGFPINRALGRALKEERVLGASSLSRTRTGRNQNLKGNNGKTKR
jgi:hypothetical protein